MIDGAVFPDQALVEHVRQRLWGEREFGRAAVLVGSGFSRNAEPVAAGVVAFPVWSDLTSRMFDELHPPGGLSPGEHEDNKVRYVSSVGAARLADEYSTYRGRSALDELLIEAVPDSRYRPGLLHRMLLTLPWADVFTTNWDTLLERAAGRVYDRSYGVVLDASDIPVQEQPRIVKLHGSFPAHRPFVVTEEDFRTYPAKFAPFLNLVQQSAMENTLCLIGFSGDDPNFLRWSGWVRDYLGESAPHIYLCGLLDLSSSSRKLLESRNVVPVDLSPLFPPSMWPDRDERHRQALEWLLRNLHEGKPPDDDEWLNPDDQRRRWPLPDPRLPSVPPGPEGFTASRAPDPLSVFGPEADQIKELREVRDNWQRQRREYPGWVIAPHHKRELLLRDTEYSIDNAFDLANRLPPPENLSLLYELNWRLERALIPLFNHWSERIEEALVSFNPYPGLIDLGGDSATFQTGGHEQWDRGEVAAQWVELAFALAREAREDQDEGRFRTWMDRLDTVADRRAEWRARWFFEESLFRLFRSDQEGFRAALERWPEDLGPPFWDVKHAGLLAELGELKVAERIARNALLSIREQLQPSGRDLALLSQEGWAMLLLERIHSTHQVVQESGEIYRERYRELEARRCNPLAETEGAVLRLSGPPPTVEGGRQVETKGTFDPGRRRTSIRFGEGLFVKPYLPAFGFLRMLEEGGAPLRCGDRLEPAAIATSARWIEQLAPFWSLSALLRTVRTGSEEELEPWFGRVRVATLSPEEVERLYSIFEAGFDQAVRRLKASAEEMNKGNKSLAVRQAKVLSFMLSRISIRLPAEQRARMFERAMAMYRGPLFKQSIEMHDCVGLVLGRLLSQAMGQEEILDRMDRLLSSPMPEDDGLLVRAPSEWPEPMGHVSWEPGSKLDPEFDRSAWDPHVERLLSIARNGSGVARGRALQRLLSLYQLEALTGVETASFGDVLWSRPDPTGFPSDMPRNLRVSFLSLPSPASVDVEALFRRYALSLDFSQVSLPDGGLRLSGGEEIAALELHGGHFPMAAVAPERRLGPVDWSTDDVKAMLQRMWERWKDERDTLARYLGDGSDLGLMDNLVGRFGDWLHLLADTILPRLKEADDETKGQVRDLLTGMESIGISTTYAYPATLFLDEATAPQATDRLWKGLSSSEHREVEEAIKATVLWLTLRGIDEGIPEPPDHLLEEIVNRIVARKTPALDAALVNVLYVLRGLQHLLGSDLLRAMCVGLRYLREDTELPVQTDEQDPGAGSSPLPVDDRPYYRRLSAAVAAAVAGEFERRGERVPEVLEAWRLVGSEDPLPEVRRAWRASATFAGQRNGAQTATAATSEEE